jgi:hypothetical protein
MRARRRTPATLLLGTTSSSARRHSAGYCFVPDCERVRVDGGAALRVLQGRPVRREANPCFRPREGIRAEPARRPGKRGKQALLQSHTRSHARFVLRAAVCALRAKGRGGPATSLSRRELHETTAISSRRAPAPTWLFVGLLGVFRGNWRVPENRGVPGSSPGLAMSEVPAYGLDLSKGGATLRAAAAAVFRAMSFPRPKPEGG